MFVCICNAVTDRQVEHAVAEGADALDTLAARTGAGACCGSCRPLLLEIIQEQLTPASLAA